MINDTASQNYVTAFQNIITWKIISIEIQVISIEIQRLGKLSSPNIGSDFRFLSFLHS